MAMQITFLDGADLNTIELTGKVMFKIASNPDWQEEDANIVNGIFNGFNSKFDAVEVILPKKDASGSYVTGIGENAMSGCI